MTIIRTIQDHPCAPLSCQLETDCIEYGHAHLIFGVEALCFSQALTPPILGLLGITDIEDVMIGVHSMVISLS
jgi:hypothetical protein